MALKRTWRGKFVGQDEKDEVIFNGTQKTLLGATFMPTERITCVIAVVPPFIQTWARKHPRVWWVWEWKIIRKKVFIYSPRMYVPTHRQGCSYGCGLMFMSHCRRAWSFIIRILENHQPNKAVPLQLWSILTTDTHNDFPHILGVL